MRLHSSLGPAIGLASALSLACEPPPLSSAPCNDDDDCALAEECVAGACAPASGAARDAGRNLGADSGAARDAGGLPDEPDAGATTDGGGPAVDGGLDLGDGGPDLPGGWWHGGFGARVPIAIVNDADEELTDLPLLVALGDDALVALAGEGGAAIRFVDDQNRSLPHDIERSAADGIEVWVGAPPLRPQSTTTIWLYLDHPTATATERPAEVFAGYRAVYHLAGNGHDDGPLVLDAVPVGTLALADGVAGDALTFAGTDHLDLGRGLVHARAVPAVTTCAFFSPSALPGGQSILSLAIGGGLSNTSRVALELVDDGVRYFGRGLDTSASIQLLEQTGSVAVGAWSWLCGRFDFAGGALALMRDGAVIATEPSVTSYPTTPDTASANGCIGAADLGDGLFLRGVLDELRVSGVARSDAWHRAEYLAMTGALATLGALETIERAPPPNAPPLAADDDIAVLEDSGRALLDVLAGDSDPDGDALTLLAVTSTTLGALRIGPTNTLVFQPFAGISGEETLGYTVGDGNGGTATGSLRLTVTAVDDPPAAAAVSTTVFGRQPRTITLGGSDVDTAAGALSYSIVAGPSAGTLAGHTDGDATLTYTANSNANGTDSFTYRVNDGTSNSNTATVTITRRQWWDTAWDDRVRIDVGAAGIATDLVDFPVLVVLDGARVDLGDIAADAADLRFVDEDGVTVLDHEVDAWSSASGGAVWVRVPRIAAGSTTEHFFVYYDNPAAGDVADAAAVWKSGFLAAWHLDDAADSSPLGHTLSATAGAVTNVAGLVGGATHFADGIALESAAATLKPPGSFTLSTWFSLDAAFDSASATTQVLMERYDGVNGNIALLLTGADHASLGAGALQVRVERSGQIASASAASLAFTAGTWHHVAVVGDPASDQLDLFLDGVLVAGRQGGAASAIDLGATMHLGGVSLDPTVVDGDRYLRGDLDEARVADVARSPTWIGAEVRSALDQLLSYRAEESLP